MRRQFARGLFAAVLSAASIAIPTITSAKPASADVGPTVSFSTTTARGAVVCGSSDSYPPPAKCYGDGSQAIDARRSYQSGVVGTGQTYQIWNGLLSWDTSAIPPSAAVLSATIDLAVSGVATSTGGPHSLTADWYNWGTADLGDYSPFAQTGAVDNQPFTSATSGRIRMTLSNPQNIVRGGANFRFHVQGASSDWGDILLLVDPASAPTLTVVYRTSCGGAPCQVPNLCPSLPTTSYCTDDGNEGDPSLSDPFPAVDLPPTSAPPVEKPFAEASSSGAAYSLAGGGVTYANCDGYSRADPEGTFKAAKLANGRISWSIYPTGAMFAAPTWGVWWANVSVGNRITNSAQPKLQWSSYQYHSSIGSPYRVPGSSKQYNIVPGQVLTFYIAFADGLGRFIDGTFRCAY